MNNTPNSIRDITDEEEPFGGLVINHYGIYNKADQKALNAYILGEVMELIGVRGWTEYEPDPKYSPAERFHIVPYTYLTKRIEELKRSKE